MAAEQLCSGHMMTHDDAMVGGAADSSQVARMRLSTPILHIDMDAFFAAVELVERPELRDQAVIVAGTGRSVVLSATYPARSFGVRSAMPLANALRRCPHAIVIPPTHAKYQLYSRKVMEIFHDVTPAVEPVSIDEAFLDVSGAWRHYGNAAEVAKLIRERIAQELGITATVGAAVNKFVAKLASTGAKPDGLAVIEPAETVGFVQSLPVRALWGVGESTALELDALGIATAADLAHMPLDILARRLGQVRATHLHALAWARDDRPVAAGRVEKSLGHDRTFETDMTRAADLDLVLLDLAHRCARRLRAREKLASTVTLRLRTADFVTITRAQRLHLPTDLAQSIFQAAVSLRERHYREPDSIRLIGLRLEGLEDHGYQQQEISFDGVDLEGRRRLETLMDGIDARYGEGSVRSGSLIPFKTSSAAGKDLS